MSILTQADSNAIIEQQLDEKITRRAAEVAKLLNKTEHWHSHSRGLSIAVLRSELKLRIEDYSDSEELRARIRDYYNLLVDFMVQRRHEGVLHVKGCYTPYIGGT